MDIEAKKAKLMFLQNFFLVSFLVGYLFLVFSSLLCASTQVHDFQHKIMVDWFGISAETANWLVVLLLGLWKILIIQFTLVPGVAIWLIRIFCKCKRADE